MRSSFRKFATTAILSLFCAFAGAQQVTVSVGTVTKYSGIATNESDIRNLKEINENLNTLESYLAKEFVSHGDIDYLDRMNTDRVFQELHLSSSSAFNASSGALKGLLGRLDFLVVIDSAEPTTSRVRLIDIETGAVKAIETCKRKTSFMGSASDSAPDCIVPFVANTRNVARIKLAAKTERLRLHVTEEQAAKQKATSEQNARLKEQMKAQQIAQAQADAQAKAQAELDAQISGIRPVLDDAIARLASANDFWEKLSRQLASSGQSLRPSVKSTLYSANADGRRCQEFLSQSNVNEVKTCISKLNSDLDKLDNENGLGHAE
jgi:hypothetical protein